MPYVRKSDIQFYLGLSPTHSALYCYPTFATISSFLWNKPDPHLVPSSRLQLLVIPCMSFLNSLLFVILFSFSNVMCFASKIPSVHCVHGLSLPLLPSIFPGIISFSIVSLVPPITSCYCLSKFHDYPLLKVYFFTRNSKGILYCFRVAIAEKHYSNTIHYIPVTIPAA